MKTDMNLINLVNLERGVPEKRDMANINREQIQAQRPDSSIAGNERSKEAENACFRETMERVSQKVRQTAERPARLVIKREDMEQGRENGVKVKVKIENFVASESAEKKENMCKSVSKEQGKMIALDSLTAISKMLNLNPNIINGLKSLEIGVLSEAVIEQFSEILCALKGISSLLENAAQTNVALDVNGKVIEPQEAANLEKGLRVELFRLQVALEALGIAGDVSRSAAFKMNLAVDGGIPQAVNPASIKMPDAQVNTVLGDVLKSNREQIASVIARMAALAKGETQVVQDGALSEKADLNTLLKAQNFDKVEVKVLNSAPASKIGEALNSVAVPAAKPNANPADLCNVSSQVMRQLLKIDGNAQYPQKEANAEEVKVQLSLNPAIPSEQNVKQDQNIAPVIKSSANQIEQIPGVEAVGKTEAQQTEINTKLPVFFKTLEENIMFQVTQKLSQAVKNSFHEIRIALKPESLGNMRMTIKMEGDIIMARITVENQQVKQIIESNLQSLKNSLMENNLQAGAFDVNVNRGSQNEADNSRSFSKDAGSAVDKAESGEEAVNNMKLTAGIDTGRRFGANTIEYFA